MSVISYICFLGCALILLTLWGKGRDPFAPGRIFMFIWLFAIGLADFKFSGYQSEWSLYAWMILAIGIASFMLGLFIPFVLYLPRHGLTIHEIRSTIHQFNYNETKAFAGITWLFIAYILCYAIEVAVMGYIPIFMFKADRARVEFGLFGFHLVVTSMPAILFLIVQYFLLIKKNHLKKAALILMFLITAVTFFMLLVRFLFVTWAVMSLIYFYYSSHRFKFRWVGLAVLAFYGMLQYILTFRVAIYAKNYIYIISKMKYSEDYAAFTEPYMYIVMNFENFARGVEKLGRFAYGYFTADPLLALVGLKHGMANYFALNGNPFLVSGYNTWPFLWPYYLDFGVLGVAVLPFVLGLAIGISYYRMRVSPTPVNVMLYAIGYYIIVISFFTNPLNMLTMLFNFTVLIGFQKWVTAPSTHQATVARI